MQIEKLMKTIIDSKIDNKKIVPRSMTNWRIIGKTICKYKKYNKNHSNSLLLCMETI